MTYQEIIDFIRLNIDDVKSTRFKTNEPLRLFINASIRKIYSKMVANGYNPIVIDQEITLTDQVTEITFTSSLQKLLGVQSSGVRIPILDEIKARSSTCPAVFLRRTAADTYAIGWYLDLSSDLVLNVQYIPVVDTLISVSDLTGTNNSIPLNQHDLIVAWATVLALGADEDNVQLWTGVYNDLLETMIESLSGHDQEVVNADDWF